MLRIENLAKRYGQHRVFEGLTRDFAPGCYALNEEDNTGKSTLLKVIAGVLPPDGGDVFVDGISMVRSSRQAKARLAFVPDDCMGFPQLSGRELLARTAQEKKTRVQPEILRFASKLGLESHLDKPFEQMSTGTRRKVYLCAAAIGEPAVVLADGPTDGLDTSARIALAETFQLWARNRVVLFASYDAELIKATGAHCLQVASL